MRESARVEFPRLVREILRDLLNDRDWTEEDAEDQIGVPQSTLNRVLQENSDPRASTVDKLIKGLGDTPLTFFERHPSCPRDDSDPIASDLRDLLTETEAKRLLELMQEFKRLRVTEEALDALEASLRLARSAKRRRRPN